MMVDWQKNCAEEMWQLYAYRPSMSLDTEEIELDKKAMRENVARLIRLETQKSGGTHRKNDGSIEPVPNSVQMDDLPLINVCILVSACRLALAGFFGEMPEKVTASPFPVDDD